MESPVRRKEALTTKVVTQTPDLEARKGVLERALLGGRSGKKWTYNPCHEGVAWACVGRSLPNLRHGSGGSAVGGCEACRDIATRSTLRSAITGSWSAQRAHCQMVVALHTQTS